MWCSCRATNWSSVELALRTNGDEDITTNDISTPTPISTSPTPLGPITRAHARRLTHQVSSDLSSGSSYLDNGDTCTLVLLRNNGLDQREEASRRLDLNCRTDTTCDSRHDFIRTPFWLFKYFLEILSDLLSKGSGITSKSVRSQPQSLIYYRVIFSHGAASPYFGPMGRVSSWIQFGGVLGFEHDPAPLWSFSHIFITFSRRQEHSGFVRYKFSFCYFLVGARADPAARLLIFGTPPYLRFSLRPSITSHIFSTYSTCSS
jgi:hypothetical protein